MDAIFNEGMLNVIQLRQYAPLTSCDIVFCCSAAFTEYFRTSIYIADAYVLCTLNSYYDMNLFSDINM